MPATHTPLGTPNFALENTQDLLAHGRRTALAEVGLLRLGFGDTLGKDGGVLAL